MLWYSCASVIRCKYVCECHFLWHKMYSIYLYHENHIKMMNSISESNCICCITLNNTELSVLGAGSWEYKFVALPWSRPNLEES